MPCARKYYFDKKRGRYFARIGRRHPTLDAIFNRRRICFGTVFYVVTPHACKVLLEKGLPVRLPSDYLLGMIGYHNLRTLVAHPMGHYWKANEEGILAYGPFSPDGYFGLSHYEKFDATLAMYHDQGLAPFKALSFEDGVNFTAGLPIVRTSPDHGTAFEMAGRDEADPLSMRAAIFTAVDIWRNRQAWNELQEGKMEKRELADAPRKERPGKPQIA